MFEHILRRSTGMPINFEHRFHEACEQLGVFWLVVILVLHHVRYWPIMQPTDMTKAACKKIKMKRLKLAPCIKRRQTESFYVPLLRQISLDHLPEVFISLENPSPISSMIWAT